MIIPTGTAQVNLKFTGQAAPQGAEMTFGVVATEHDNPITIAGLVQTALQDSNILQGCSNSIAVSSILVKCGPNLTGPMAELGVNIPGETPDPSAPPNVALLVKKSTPLGGRMNQGRFYLPGIPETLIDASGKLLSQGLTGFQTKFTDFLEGLQAITLDMLLLHAREESDWLPQPVTGLSVQPVVATQRRRLR